ncbi:MAG: GbsR/MarR family transcriptional regulator [Cytophagaceae bacterium]
MMNKFELSEQQKLLVEKVGVFHEKAGMQPAQARILSLLLISDKVELSFEEIQEALGFSRSAISNALNALLNLNKIEYVTFPGNRKRFFRSRLMNWKEDMKEAFQGLSIMNELFKEILVQRTSDTKEFNQSLENIIDFLDHMQTEVRGMIDRWEAARK